MKARYLTSFDFYCQSFAEIDSKMKEETGISDLHKDDVWRISIDPGHTNGIHVHFVLSTIKIPDNSLLKKLKTIKIL